MNQYQRHMSPFPGLERWSHQVQLPQSGINLHVYDTGGGEDGGTPILLLHGLGDEADTWRHVLLALGPGRRAIAPDLPGFGRSDQGKYPYSIPFFAGIMLELLDMFSISHVVLVGHSTGAAVAHEFAVEHPERVEKLVLIGGSLVSKETPLNLGLFLFLVPGLGEWSYNRLRRDSQEAYRTLEAYYNRLEDLPQADRDFLFQRVNERVWSDGQRRGFLSTLRSLARWMPAQQKKLASRLRGWTIPTTVLWGENDRINPVENAHALVDLLPSARLELVSGTGHNIQQEKPGVVVNAL